MVSPLPVIKVIAGTASANIKQGLGIGGGGGALPSKEIWICEGAEVPLWRLSAKSLESEVQRLV